MGVAFQGDGLGGFLSRILKSLADAWHSFEPRCLAASKHGRSSNYSIACTNASEPMSQKLKPEICHVSQAEA